VILQFEATTAGAVPSDLCKLQIPAVVEEQLPWVRCGKLHE